MIRTLSSVVGVVSFRPVFAAFTLLGSTLLMHCDDPADRPSSVDSLRVLAVHASPSLAAPGDQVALTLLTVDGPINKPKRSVQTLWIEGCENPAGGTPSSCLGGVNRWVSKLTENEIASGVVDPSKLPSATSIGLGPTFTRSISESVLEEASDSVDGSPKRGVDMLFFAVCAGHLKGIDDANPPQGLALGCFAQDGTQLGQEDFVTGFIPIGVYANEKNQDPSIEKLVIAGVAPSDRACSVDADCPKNEACGQLATCVPIVPACDASNEDDCAGLKMAPVVTSSSVELDTTLAPSQPESLWATYFTDAGHFDDDARVVFDSEGLRTTDSLENKMIPARGYRGPAHVWVVVHDSRMGVRWVEPEVVVR
ncbi:MAG: hypothetical protein U0165_03710 [Polyangiaceae bacterium]